MLQHNEECLRREQKISEYLTEDEERAPHAVANTWLISLRMIEKKHPQAAELLYLMVFYHYQALPQSILREDTEDKAFEAALCPLLDFDFVRTTHGEDLENASTDPVRD